MENKIKKLKKPEINPSVTPISLLIKKNKTALKLGVLKSFKKKGVLDFIKSIKKQEK